MNTRSRARVYPHSMRRFLGTMTLVCVALFRPATADAKDLLDYVIQAVDPTLAPARPLIECVAGGGEALACAAEVAKKQGKSALPIGPEDDRVKKAVAVLMAARDERWLDVVKIGGEVVAKSVACAIIPVQGPAKGPACSIVGWVISKNVGALDKAYQALKGPDWWALVDLLGAGVCELIPASGTAGAAKAVLCGAFAGVLLEAKKMAETVAKGIVSGADALENAIFGDDSHMPYDTYYALYWQPWYHAGVDRVLKGEHLGSLQKPIWNTCVNYFDSHNQYRKTARKTCDNMRDKRYDPQVKAFGKALPVAVDGYFESVARPAIRAAVVASYGKASSAKGDLPGETFFQQNCAFTMRARFPFPDPDEGRCKLIESHAAKYPHMEKAFKAAAAKCMADVVKQLPEPTAWSRTCEAIRPQYKKAFASEALKLIGTGIKLKKKGCKPPEKGTKDGFRMTCTGTSAYSACLTSFGTLGQKICRLAIPVVQAKDQKEGGGNVGAVKPQVPAATAKPARQAPAPAPVRPAPPPTPVRPAPPPPPPPVRRTAP